MKLFNSLSWSHAAVHSIDEPLEQGLSKDTQLIRSLGKVAETQ